MPGIEAPVERIEGAGALAVLFLRIVSAGAAVVTHLTDVVGGGDIGLGGDHAAVGELAHRPRVGHFHPLDGIDVDAEIPGIDRVRVDAGEESEVAREHEPLDVVGVGIPQRLADRRSHAPHAGLARPVIARQRQVVAEEVHSLKIRHQRPVNAPHVFPPAQDLPHETFDLVDHHPFRILLPGVHRRRDDLHGSEDLGVQRE